MYIKTYLLMILALMLVLTPVMAQKQCVAGSEYIHILSKDNYAIGEPIGNISIQIADSLMESAKSGLTISLCSDESCNTEIERKSPSLDISKRTSYLDKFNLITSKSASLYIRVIVGNPSLPNHYSASKQINIMPTLLVRPYCTPLQPVIGREITCKWDVVDMDPPNDIVPGAISSVLIKQKTELFNGYANSNEIKFTPPLTGDVKVTIKSSATDYIGNTQELTLNIQPLDRTEILLVDNQDHISVGELKTGNHQIELKIEESGVPIEVQSVSMTLSTPSTQAIPVIFNKIGIGDYKATINLPQAGQVYTLEGDILFPLSSGKPNLHPLYQLNTAKSTTEDIGGQTNLLIILGVAGFAVIIIVVILIIALRRRK